MTSTEMRQRARGIIESIVAALDQNLMRRKFDEPVDEMVRHLRLDVKCPLGHRTFHRIIGQVVERVYREGFSAPMTAMDATSEAIALLEAEYRSNRYGVGYAAAFLDASHGSKQDLMDVLRSLAELIKERQKHRYMRAVFVTQLPVENWRLLCAVTETLLADYKPFLPETLAQCAPAQLVDQIPALICAYLHADSVLQNISAGPRASVGCETVTS